MQFDNWQEHEALPGADTPTPEMPRPRAKSYRQVPQSIRRNLLARAATFASPRVAAA